MPPSGPSAMWSSGAAAVQPHNGGAAPQAPSLNGHSHNGGAGHHDVIGSLGKALSSVALDGGNGKGGHGAGGGGPQAQGGGAGAPAGGSYGAPGSALGSRQGSWSGLSSSSHSRAPAPATTANYNFYGNDGGSAPGHRPPIAPVKDASSSAGGGAGAGGGEHESLQNILYDSGIYEKEEVTAHRRASAGPGVGPSGGLHGVHRPSTSSNSSGTDPSSPADEDRERKPSIDAFLSQSPSKTLGEDAFRHVMHRTASNPSLHGLGGGGFGGGGGHDGGLRGSGTSGSGGGGVGGGGLGGKPLSATAPSSRSESPQTLRPGSSGGSGGQHAQHQLPHPQQQPQRGSPYGAKQQQAVAYQPYGNGGANFSPQGNQGGGVHAQPQGQLHAQLQLQQQPIQQQPSMSSQFSAASGGNVGTVPPGMGGVAQPQVQQSQLQPQHVQQQPPSQQQQSQVQPQYMPVPVSQQQPQVFYMAVPAPDGKGQVLQPVQMMQMPGQPGALMMPVAMAPGTQGGDLNQGVAPAAQPMMLMQPVQAAPGMAPMYQDGGQGGGNNGDQFGQYGVAQQQALTGGGYDGMGGRYQSNNKPVLGRGMDLHLGGGGQYQHDQTRQVGGGGGDPTGGHQGQGGGGMPGQGGLSALYASPQRPPLRALLGNVRRLSRDQVGCRLLQQALDEDGPAAATAILNEGLTFWAEAMVDPFGNYLFQKILERVTPEERVTLVSSVSTRLVNASLNLHGTRSVQKIVEVCAVDEEESDEDSSQDGEGEEENKKEDEDEPDASSSSKKKKGKKKKKDTAAKILTDALRPSAARLCIDSHGNHAIQRILLKLPYRRTQFIFDAVAASVEDVARHRHGCCVIQRCLDSRHSTSRTRLVARIVEKSLELMQDAYGNYVVQYVLDVCGDDEVHAICESVVGRVCPLAVQKFSSNVMEKCLERCTDRVREQYLDELNDSDRLRELMMDPFGNYVVQRALSVSTHAQAVRLVETMKPHLTSSASSANGGGGGIRNTAGGRRILGKICRRFPNFVLEGETFEEYDLSQVLARGTSPHHSQDKGYGRARGGSSYGGYNPQHNPHQAAGGGPSPNHRRGRGKGYHNHHGGAGSGGGTIPQYQQPPVAPPQPQQLLNVQQADMNTMPTAYGGNPYMFPHSN